MTEQGITKTRALRAYALKLVDSVYNVSVYTVIGYTAVLLLLSIVAMAVHLRVVDVPEFHP